MVSWHVTKDLFYPSVSMYMDILELEFEQQNSSLVYMIHQLIG